jgi:hypothetical protein
MPHCRISFRENGEVRLPFFFKANQRSLRQVAPRQDLPMLQVQKLPLGGQFSPGSGPDLFYRDVTAFLPQLPRCGRSNCITVENTDNRSKDRIKTD